MKVQRELPRAWWTALAARLARTLVTRAPFLEDVAKPDIHLIDEHEGGETIKQHASKWLLAILKRAVIIDYLTPDYAYAASFAALKYPTCPSIYHTHSADGMLRRH